MMTYSIFRPTQSPEPGKRRCTDCGYESTNLVVLELPGSSLFYWYHLDCVPPDRLVDVWMSEPRVVVWQTNMWGKIHLSEACAGKWPARKVVTADQIDDTEAGVCRRCGRDVASFGSHYPFRQQIPWNVVATR